MSRIPQDQINQLTNANHQNLAGMHEKMIRVGRIRMIEFTIQMREFHERVANAYKDIQKSDTSILPSIDVEDLYILCDFASLGMGIALDTIDKEKLR